MENQAGNNRMQMLKILRVKSNAKIKSLLTMYIGLVDLNMTKHVLAIINRLIHYFTNNSLVIGRS